MKEESSLSDKEIVQAIRSSDTGQFQELYYRYYEALYRFFWIRINSTELSKDFVQDVFTRVWKNRSRLDPNKSVKAYLYRIANNLAIDYFRKKGHEQRYLSDLKQRKPTVYHDPVEMKITIDRAVHDLPEKVRQIFIFSRYEGLTYQEIAEVCQISIKTVEARMSQALNLLRETLLLFTK